MMRVIFILISIVTFSCSSRGGSNTLLDSDTTLCVKHITVHDTLYTINLVEEIKNDCYVGEYIRIFRNGKHYCNIVLPSADEIKNFQVELLQKKDMLIMNAEWGGGKYNYIRTFYFMPLNGNLVLFKYDKGSIIEDSEKQYLREVNIDPPIKICEFDIMDYIENEP